MSIVTSYDWESDTFTQHQPDPVRAAWRSAVDEVATKAEASLPQSRGRIEAAVKIVLAGDVVLQADGTAKVASQSNGTTVYHVVNGECTCKDFPTAPQGFCKHRLAFGIHKRARRQPSTMQPPAWTLPPRTRGARARTSRTNPPWRRPAPRRCSR